MIYRFCCQESLSDKLSGDILIHSVDEVYSVAIDTSEVHKIIFEDDAVRNNFTPASFNEFIVNLRKLNPSLVLDYVPVNTYRDDIIRLINMANNPRDFLHIMSHQPKEFIDTVKGYASTIQESTNNALLLSSRISEMQRTTRELIATNEELKKQVNDEQTNKLYYQTQFDNLVARINHTYTTRMNTNANVIKFNSYDKIIYFKEISRVRYFDTFMYYLQQIIVTLFSMPCRFLVIEPYGANGKITQYPRHIPHHTLTTNDVISGDILMMGFQPKLAENIARNGSHISILLVLDRDGSTDIHFEGKNVEVMFVGSDPMELVGLPRDRCISYPNAGCHCIPEIADFYNYNATERLSLYSSMSLMQSIIRLIT